MVRWRPMLLVLVLAIVGCTDVHPSVLVEAEADSVAEEKTSTAAVTAPTGTTAADSATGSTTSQAAAETTTNIDGQVVSAASGQGLDGAVVSVGEISATTAADGSFSLAGVAATERVKAARPAWLDVELDQNGPGEALEIALEPRVVRGLRVSSIAAADPVRFNKLLDLADRTTVNAFVFDTKDETDRVLYETDVAFAHEIGAAQPVYDPVPLLAEAKAQGLYTITRVVTFEDALWAEADPEAKLAGVWVNAGNRETWTYPIDLAVEACQLGFDEVQFDYVRFPSGQTAETAAALVPATAEARSAAIGGFLAEARARLLAEGCGVSAAVFGIVMTSNTDERLGQTPETVSQSVDAVSPMLYPSHYSSGWLGFADPNDHPGAVIAHALDGGAGRVSTDTVLRPWLQGFYYNGAQVLAQIDEAEARGAGWIIWNASGSYSADWLPPAS